VPAVSRFATVLVGWLSETGIYPDGSVRVVLKVHSLKIKEPVLIYTIKEILLKITAGS
jgi:hypothetical protein